MIKTYIYLLFIRLLQGWWFWTFIPADLKYICCKRKLWILNLIFFYKYLSRTSTLYKQPKPASVMLLSIWLFINVSSTSPSVTLVQGGGLLETVENNRWRWWRTSDMPKKPMTRPSTTTSTATRSNGASLRQVELLLPCRWLLHKKEELDHHPKRHLRPDAQEAGGELSQWQAALPTLGSARSHVWKKLHNFIMPATIFLFLMIPVNIGTDFCEHIPSSNIRTETRIDLSTWNKLGTCNSPPIYQMEMLITSICLCTILAFKI